MGKAEALNLLTAKAAMYVYILFEAINAVTPREHLAHYS